MKDSFSGMNRTVTFGLLGPLIVGLLGAFVYVPPLSMRADKPWLVLTPMRSALFSSSSWAWFLNG
jgi:hypothetical protein